MIKTLKAKISNLSSMLTVRQKRFIVFASTAFLLTALGIIVITVFVASNDTESTEITEDDFVYATIIEGGPRISKSNRISRTLGISDVVQINDSLVNDEISMSLMVFSDNSYILLDKKTEINLSNIAITDGGSSSIVLEEGRIFVRDENLSITTPIEIKYQDTNLGGILRGAEMSTSIDEEAVILGSIRNNVIVENNQTEFEIQQSSELAISIDSINTDLNSLSENIEFKNYQEEENQWYKTIFCINNKANDVITKEGNEKNVLKESIDIFDDCIEEVQAEVFNENNQQNLINSIDQLEEEFSELNKNIPRITGIQAEFVGGEYKCAWSASGTNISKYEYKVIENDEQDIIDWTETNELTVDIPTENFVYANNYVCSVRAYSEDERSIARNSDPRIYDNSEASVEAGLNDSFPKVAGTARYSNVSSEDLEITIYLQSQDSRYSNGNALVSDVYFHSTNFTNVSDDRIEWETNTSFSGSIQDYDGYILYAQIKNIETGTILDQSSYEIEYTAPEPTSTPTLEPEPSPTPEPSVEPTPSVDPSITPTIIPTITPTP